MHRPLLATAAALLLIAPTADAQSTIQPGAMLRTEVGQCTMNFVYDGVGATAGKVYLGTAAHCGDKVGGEARDGDDVAFGRFAFIGDADEPATDYAFIEVAPEHLARVDPAMKGHPEYPTGFTTAEETSAGDMIQMSGYGVGFGLTQPTQEERQTVLQTDDEEIFTLSGPSVNGDSGGPFVHIDTGKALGLVSMYGFQYAATDVGPTIQGVLAKAAKAGFPVTLRAAGQPAPAAPPPEQPGSQSPPPAQSPPPPPSSGSGAQPSPSGTSRSGKPKKKRKAKPCSKKALKKAKSRKAKRAIRRCMRAKARRKRR